MSKRIFLDDIEQAWVSINLDTRIISSNDYNKDLRYRLENVLDAEGNAQLYWHVLDI